MSDTEHVGRSQRNSWPRPEVELIDAEAARIPCDRLLVFVTQREDGELMLPDAVDGLGDGIRGALHRAAFRGSTGDRLILESLGRLAAHTLALVGVGPVACLKDAVVRDAAIRGVAGSEAGVVTICPGEMPGRFVPAAVEGVMRGLHRFDLSSATRRLGPPQSNVEIRIPRPAGAVTWADECRTARILAESVNWVRDLVDLPSHIATPARLAEEAVYLASNAPVRCEVLGRRKLEELGFGGVLAVGSGGKNPPCVVILRYEATGGRPVGLVGKGVTFDSGGYHLKSLGEMREMKADMCGAAAVMGAVRAAALCGVRQDVVAVLPFVENLVDRRAFRPSDVVTHYGGKTSEVVDPDNEGRVILADALSYLAEVDPVVMIDVASLTDGGGLGPDLAAVFGNDRGLVAEILSAGAESGEPVWELPLWRPYRSQLQSRIADIANADPATDSAVLAALFLAEFTGELPWAHIDLGTSGYRGSDGHKEASGAGTRTLWNYLSSRAVASSAK